MAIAKNSLVKKTEGNTFSTFITGDGVKRKINEMMGGKNGESFITTIVSCVSNNPALKECEHGSILSAALTGAGLKLSPSPQLGQFFLVPFNDNRNGRKTANFQLGYKGYIQLAIRSGQYKKLNVVAIKEGELVSYNPLTEDIEVNLIEDEETREATATVGYYAMFEYTNGFRKTMYWNRKKMQVHAEKYSQAYKTDLKKKWTNSFWSKDFDGMAFKTMLRQLISKWGIMSVDMQTAFEEDNAGMSATDASPDYVDLAPAETEPEPTVEAEPNSAPASGTTDSFFDGGMQQ